MQLMNWLKSCDYLAVDWNRGIVTFADDVTLNELKKAVVMLVGVLARVTGRGAEDRLRRLIGR